LELSVNNHTADFSLRTWSGPSVSLSCLVQDSSQAEELLWYREDGQVDLKDGNNVNVSNICISPVTESDNGVTFTCKLARNESVQVSVILDVLCELQWWISVQNGWGGMKSWPEHLGVCALGEGGVFCTLVRCLHQEKMHLEGDNSCDKALPFHGDAYGLI